MLGKKFVEEKFKEPMEKMAAVTALALGFSILAICIGIIAIGMSGRHAN